MDKAAEEEFRAYVSARGGGLFRAALLLTGHREDAEDLVQSALAKLAARWTRLGEGSPDAYVRKILYHQQVNRWRNARHRRERTTAEPPDAPAATDFAENSTQRLVLARPWRS